jgi:hypothetical protein
MALLLIKTIMRYHVKRDGIIIGATAPSKGGPGAAHDTGPVRTRTTANRTRTETFGLRRMVIPFLSYAVKSWIPVSICQH